VCECDVYLILRGKDYSDFCVSSCSYDLLLNFRKFSNCLMMEKDLLPRRLCVMKLVPVL
jgi:hypothetical protein